MLPRADGESTPAVGSHGQAAFAFVFVTVALDMLALGIMIPVLPQLIARLEHGNVASAAARVGLFGFTWATMQFAFSPVLGALSDHFGRRPVILLSNLGLGLDYVLMALAPNLTWLWIGRVVSGITAASVSTAGAYIADVTDPEKRAAKFGMLGAAFGLGFVIGPVSAVLVGPAVKWLGERGARLVGHVFGTAGFATFAAASDERVFFTGIPLLALWGLADPSMQGLMTRRLGPSDQGRLQGAPSSLAGSRG